MSAIYNYKLSASGSYVFRGRDCIAVLDCNVLKISEERDTARLFSSAPEMLDALITALPYIETAELDEAYKPGVVSKVSKQIRDAIAKAEGKEAPDA